MLILCSQEDMWSYLMSVQLTVWFFLPLLSRVANKKDMSPHRMEVKKKTLDTVKNLARGCHLFCCYACNTQVAL